MAEFLDPTSIAIPPNRQRTSELSTADLEADISARGLIHAIVVREVEGVPTLVVGERRLRAMIALGRKLSIGDEVKFWNHLTPTEACEVELEENIKRSDLPWRDTVRSIGTLHSLYSMRDESWNVARSAAHLALRERWLYTVLAVHRKLSDPLLESASSIDHAYSILERAAERRTADIVNSILETSAEVFKAPADAAADAPVAEDSISTDLADSAEEWSTPISPSTPSEIPPIPSASPVPSPVPSAPIILSDFLTWAPSYSGPKFNLIHVDFPYDVDYRAFAKSVERDGYDSGKDIYGRLLTCFIDNLDRFTSYSAHIMFWFSMTAYEETKRKLASAGLFVHDHPFIWLKTDNSGIVPGVGGQYPRRIYETAFLASRGNRPLIRASGNAYGCPIVSPSLHPSHKPEPMLRHFLGMLTDSVTDFFDPSCGSGASIRSAEDCGARRVLGLELSPAYHATALSTTLRARTLRAARGIS